MDIYEPSLKTLIGLSIPTPEVEDDLDDEQLVDKAIAQYDYMNVLSTIGNEDFREVYTCFKNVIILQEHQDQINFCRALIQKVEEVYDFTFQPIDYDYESPVDFYEFIEWLEYDNDEFLFQLFDGLINNNLYMINITQTVNDEWTNIEKKIMSINMANRFKTEFIRTNNKENLISFIVKNTEKNRSLIIERFFMKGEKHD